MVKEIQILNNGEPLYDIRRKVNENFEAVQENVLTREQITNCLLEVPQHIKLEVVNGALTLKAGSRVIIPNGFEPDGITPKFEYETILGDVTRTFSTNDGNLVVYSRSVPWAQSNEQRFDYFTNGDNMFSGATQPTPTLVNGLWYNTATNKIMASADFGSTWVEVYCSLPICIINSSDQRTITGIQQVFNGFGYIGSTIWISEGVKGLAPNGRNDDGSLKNYLWDVPSITTLTIDTITSHINAVIAFNSHSPIDGHQFGVISTQSFRYDEPENKNYDINSEWAYTPLAYAAVTNGVITAFSQRLPFRAIDSQDAVKVYNFTSDKWEYDSDLDVYVLNTGQVNRVGINIFKTTELGGVITEFVDIVDTAQGVLTLHALQAFDGYLVFA